MKDATIIHAPCALATETLKVRTALIEIAL